MPTGSVSLTSTWRNAWPPASSASCDVQGCDVQGCDAAACEAMLQGCDAAVLRGDAIGDQLVLDEPAVGPAPRHQLVVAALLDDARALDHDDAVGVADRAQAVRDDDRRARPA